MVGVAAWRPRGWPARDFASLCTAALGWAATAAVGIAGLGLAMDRGTDAALPYWDATTTVLSLIAQYLLARKVLENWVLWIVVDVLCIGIYGVKGLYPTAGLYAVFLVLATIGLITWSKTTPARSAPAAA